MSADLLTRSDAVISDCGGYRYLLTRTWNDAAPAVLFVMLNPSTADATVDDATIRRCVGFARAWGCGELRVLNLFAWRATDPRDLRLAADPVGPQNDHMLAAEAWKASQAPGGITVCAWGAGGGFRDRDRAVLGILRHARPQCLRATADGLPSHPLYQPRGLRPVPYEGRP